MLLGVQGAGADIRLVEEARQGLVVTAEAHEVEEEVAGDLPVLLFENLVVLIDGEPRVEDDAPVAGESGLGVRVGVGVGTFIDMVGICKLWVPIKILSGPLTSPFG